MSRTFVVFTDLDGTLLDHATYAYEAAQPALERLRREQIPLILCTSKTRAELAPLRSALENEHPFIVENGGAIYVPDGYFPFGIGGRSQHGMTVIELGTPYGEIVRGLAAASRETGVRVRGFSEMGVAAVAEATGLSLDDARLACDREFDEPFEVLDGDRDALLAAITRMGYRWTSGGRFYHIMGANDKAVAVRRLIALYRQRTPALTTIGLGDAPNDAEFLRCVDIPIVIAATRAPKLSALVPQARLTRLPGPAGWNAAVLDVLDRGT